MGSHRSRPCFRIIVDILVLPFCGSCLESLQVPSCCLTAERVVGRDLSVQSISLRMEPESSSGPNVVVLQSFDIFGNRDAHTKEASKLRGIIIYIRSPPISSKRSIPPLRCDVDGGVSLEKLQMWKSPRLRNGFGDLCYTLWSISTRDLLGCIPTPTPFFFGSCRGELWLGIGRVLRRQLSRAHVAAWPMPNHERRIGIWSTLSLCIILPARCLVSIVQTLSTMPQGSAQ